MFDDRQIGPDGFQLGVDPLETMGEQSIDELCLLTKILFERFVISHARSHCETRADDRSGVIE